MLCSKSKELQSRFDSFDLNGNDIVLVNFLTKFIRYICSFRVFFTTPVCNIYVLLNKIMADGT